MVGRCQDLPLPCDASCDFLNRDLSTLTLYFNLAIPTSTRPSHHQWQYNMADIKALKDAVWLKKEEVKKEEQGLAEWAEQVSNENTIVKPLLTTQTAPDNSRSSRGSWS